VPPQHIAGKAGQFHYDSVINRDLVVLAADTEALPEPPPLSPKQAQERADDLALLVSRSLRIDEATARFYLRDADGDIKKAIRCGFTQSPSCFLWQGGLAADAHMQCGIVFCPICEGLFRPWQGS
jgi:hypothetical protein